MEPGSASRPPTSAKSGGKIQWLPKLPQCLYIFQRFKYCCSMNQYFPESLFVS